jgi:hypothetical protein
MRQLIVLVPLLIAFAGCGLTLTLAGCGGGRLEGQYSGTMHNAMGGPLQATLDFRSNGKVFITTAAGDAIAGTFEVDGDKVAISAPPWVNLVLTRASDGSLTSGLDIRFTKK